MSIKDIDLSDVTAPEEVAIMLRAAADNYRESMGELQAAWGDKNAGAVWGDIAKALDKAASAVDKACDKWGV